MSRAEREMEKERKKRERKPKDYISSINNNTQKNTEEEPTHTQRVCVCFLMNAVLCGL